MATKEVEMKPGDTVRLKGVGLIYTLLEVNTHNKDTDYECQWGVLKPVKTATYTAHWAMNQLEPV